MHVTWDSGDVTSQHLIHPLISWPRNTHIYTLAPSPKGAVKPNSSINILTWEILLSCSVSSRVGYFHCAGKWVCVCVCACVCVCVYLHVGWYQLQWQSNSNYVSSCYRWSVIRLLFRHLQSSGGCFFTRVAFNLPPYAREWSESSDLTSFLTNIL